MINASIVGRSLVFVRDQPKKDGNIKVTTFTYDLDAAYFALESGPASHGTSVAVVPKKSLTPEVVPIFVDVKELKKRKKADE